MFVQKKKATKNKNKLSSDFTPKVGISNIPVNDTINKIDTALMMAQKKNEQPPMFDDQCRC
jgi:hypothetical protein